MSIATPLAAARRPDPTPALARRRPACRPRTLVDLMVFVAATAVGLATCRAMWEQAEFDPGSWTHLFLAAPCVASCSLALVMLRLRRPRLNFRRIVRQPGAMACLAVVTLLAFRMAVPLGVAALCGLKPGSWVGRFCRESVLAGYVVAAAWLTLAITGIRRTEPGWIDRLGRIFGTYWIILVFMSYWSEADSLLEYSRSRQAMTSYLRTRARLPLPALTLPPQAGDEAPPQPASPAHTP